MNDLKKNRRTVRTTGQIIVDYFGTDDPECAKRIEHDWYNGGYLIELETAEQANKLQNYIQEQNKLQSHTQKKLKSGWLKRLFGR